MRGFHQWNFCELRKIVGCICAGNSSLQRKPWVIWAEHASRHVTDPLSDKRPIPLYFPQNVPITRKAFIFHDIILSTGVDVTYSQICLWRSWFHGPVSQSVYELMEPWSNYLCLDYNSKCNVIPHIRLERLICPEGIVSSLNKSNPTNIRLVKTNGKYWQINSRYNHMDNK